MALSSVSDGRLKMVSVWQFLWLIFWWLPWAFSARRWNFSFLDHVALADTCHYWPLFWRCCWFSSHWLVIFWRVSTCCLPSSNLLKNQCCFGGHFRSLFLCFRTSKWCLQLSVLVGVTFLVFLVWHRSTFLLNFGMSLVSWIESTILLFNLAWSHSSSSSSCGFLVLATFGHAHFFCLF